MSRWDYHFLLLPSLSDKDKQAGRQSGGFVVECKTQGG